MSNKWYHSCCGAESGKCPGCPGGMYLMRKSKKDKEENKDELLEEILRKIKNNTVVSEDFNNLIKESTPESIRNRVRRRTNIDPLKRHRDRKGHQSIKLPDFKKRIQPKRKPVNQQNHGRSKLAHKHSTDTQRKNAYLSELNWVKENIGKSINEEELSALNVDRLSRLTLKMLSIPNINRDWLFKLNNILEDRSWELYHGSNSEQFIGKIRVGERDAGWFGHGFYLSAYPSYAARWGKNVYKMQVPKGRYARINVTDGYKKMDFLGDAEVANKMAGGQDGYLEDELKWAKLFTYNLYQKGYDGVRISIDHHRDVEVLVFDPSKIKVLGRINDGR